MFKKGDVVVPVGDDSMSGAAVVMGVTPEGLLRLRLGTQDWVASYWPNDWKKVTL